MEFKKYKMEDIATFSQGKQVEIENQYTEQKENMKRFLRIIDFTNPNEPIRYVKDFGDRYYATKDDLVMIRYGSQTCGKVVIGKEGIIANNMFKINLDNSTVLNRYAYYCLKQDTVYNYLRGSQNSSTMPSINFGILNKLEIEVPSIDNQKKIIKILNDIDQKIELNNEINNNLYELSNNLFKKVLEENEIKEYKRLDEISDCQNGHAFYKEGYDDTGLMVVDLGNVNLNSNFIYTNADKYISKDRIPNEKFIVKKNDLVMIMTDRKATMDLLGKTAKIYENKEYALNQRIYRIRSKINVNYLYTYLNSDKVSNELKSKALGSVQKYINTNVINEIMVPLFEDEIMEKFSNIVNPIFEYMEYNISENKILEQLRDTLLPKLMNGEIDLDSIEI